MIGADQLDVRDQRGDLYPLDVTWAPATVACVPTTGRGAYPALAADTPRSAESIRTVGHRAVGTAVTTWIPPQSAPVVNDVPEPEGDHRAVMPGDVTTVAAVTGQAGDHNGACPVCLTQLEAKDTAMPDRIPPVTCRLRLRRPALRVPTTVGQVLR